MAFHVTSSPTPGHFYRAKTGDTLLGIIGRAYGARSGTKRRLSMTKMANAHPQNWRLHRPSKNTFERNHFPVGIVSLARRFPCPDAMYNSSPENFLDPGKCRPVIYIPPETDIWFPPPFEVEQDSGFTCWAAALTSLTQARRLKQHFTDQEELARAVSAITIPGRRRPKSIVSPRNLALRYFPRKDVAAAAGNPAIARGEITMTLMSHFFGLKPVSFFGDAKPGDIQKKRDHKLKCATLEEAMRRVNDPLILFRANGVRARAAGHASVVFGASEVDDIYIEMDPLALSERGPVLGMLGTRVVRQGSRIGTGPTGDASREIYLML